MKILNTNIEKYEDEILTTLDKELEAAWQEVEKAQHKVDLINEAKARYHTALLFKELRGKKEQSN